MTEKEPTPRQKRTEQLLDKAKEGHRAINANLAFLQKSSDMGGLLGATLMGTLWDTLFHQQDVNRHLLMALDNMAGAPCFDKKGS